MRIDKLLAAFIMTLHFSFTNTGCLDRERSVCNSLSPSNSPAKISPFFHIAMLIISVKQAENCSLKNKKTEAELLFFAVKIENFCVNPDRNYS